MRKRYLYIVMMVAMMLSVATAWAATPFKVTTVTKEGFAPDTEWYTMTIGSSALFISDNADKEFIAIKSNRSDLADADLWCFTGDEKSGFRIYNKQAGAGKVLSAPVQMKVRRNIKSLKVTA